MSHSYFQQLCPRDLQHQEQRKSDPHGIRETNLFVYCTYIRSQSENHKVTFEQENRVPRLWRSGML
jgi:hypothetical protein